MRKNALNCNTLLSVYHKDFNNRCKGGYILGKTKLNGPVSLPITTSYSLPPTWDRFRQKKDSRMRNDRAKLHELALDPIQSWSTEADSCPPSDFSDRPPISISMTTGRKWLTWNRSISSCSPVPSTGKPNRLVIGSLQHWCKPAALHCINRLILVFSLSFHPLQ